MATTLSTLLNILATPPGDLVYHLVVSLILIITVVFTLINRGKANQGNQLKYFLIGCSIVLLLQLILFGLRSYNSDPIIRTGYFYPLMERLFSTLTIIWLVWSLLEEEHDYIPTSFYIILSITLIFLAVVSIFANPILIHLSIFKPLTLDLIWQCIALAMIIIGLLLAFFQHPTQKNLTILILILLASGHIVQILLVNEMRWFMGAVRLAQMVGLPVLLLWAKRASSSDDRITLAEAESESLFSAIKEKSQLAVENVVSKFNTARSTSLSRVKALTQRSSKTDQPVNHPEMKSDKGQVEMTLDTKPALVNQLLKINLAHTSEEKYQVIAQALSLSVVADICFLVKIPERTEKLHIVTGYDLIRETHFSPDVLAREDLPNIINAWNAHQALELSNDQAETRDILTLAMLIKYHSIGNLFAYPLGLPGKPLAGGVIFLSPYTGKRWGDKPAHLLDTIKDILAQILYRPDPKEQAQLALNQVQLQASNFMEEANALRTALAEKDVQLRENENQIKELTAKYQIEQLETTSSIEQMKRKIAEMTPQVGLGRGTDSTVEQLRTKIRQLTDEQEHLRIALNRANGMIKELQTEAGQTGPIRLSLESQIISLDSIAANVRLRVGSQIQQKDIVLEIHNPDGRQMVKTDPELLQTSLHALLINAIRASEPGGTIKLELILSFEMGMLIIQVTDHGEGLTQAEQTALFSAQHEDVPGIGDVQSIRSAIRSIRVLNGKIWLKSEKESFTTFRFQIPVRIID